jgi:phospholipase C
MRRYFVCAFLLAACGGGSDTPPPIDARPVPDTLGPPDLPRTKSDSELATDRAACQFETGAWPAETIGKEYPLGDDIPIKHVIVITQENRSFDQYLGRLVAQGYYQPGEVDVPPDNWSLPDGNGGTVGPHLDTDFCFGVNHGWDDMHQDWNNGANDQFVINNNPGGARSISYEDDSIIPFYYALASTFAVGDRYFASVMTSTWPNRMFQMAATSFGIGDNSLYAQVGDDYTPTVFLRLQQAGHTWKDYTDGPHQVMFFIPFGTDGYTQQHYGDVRCDLFADITNDTLPDVSFVMGDEVNGESTDEGPSALPGIGGQLVEKLIRALWASPAWKDTVVFINYDENGGTADHVPPADACAPDAFAPHDKVNHPLAGDFTKTGFRVPFIVVSPYTKAHYVSHTVMDHTSVTRFIEAKFWLPALTGRDANAAVPMDMFDFEHPPFMTPPTITATTTVPDEVLNRCGQTMAPIGCQ